MNRKTLRADFLLLLTAAVWGFGFVAQRSGMEHIGPFAYNGIRFILGSLSLLPLILVRRKRINRSKLPVLPSVAAGGILFIAVILQQIGIIFTTAGNAGFITGLYVVFTPIFGIFLGRKTGLPTWIGSVLTLAGMYFISIVDNSGSVNPGDIIVFISAFFWTAHVLLIDRLMNKTCGKSGSQTAPKESLNPAACSQSGLPEAHAAVKSSAESSAVNDKRRDDCDSAIDPVELSAGQFAFCGILSLIGAFAAEPFIVQIVENINVSLLNAGLFSWKPFPELISALESGTVLLSLDLLIPILYGGLGSVGIAYTLQVVAQRDAPPAHATIILCFEGCFAALGGILLLSEKAGGWTLLGFALMLAGMMATQLDTHKEHRA